MQWLILLCRYSSARMSELIEKEAERLRSSTENINMASVLTPPELPWHPSSWTHGPPNVRSGLGHGPRGDDGVTLERRLADGRKEECTPRGVAGQSIRLTWRNQTAQDQWSNFRYPTLRAYSREWTVSHVHRPWVFDQSEMQIPESCTPAMGRVLLDRLKLKSELAEDRMASFKATMARVVRKSTEDEINLRRSMTASIVGDELRAGLEEMRTRASQLAAFARQFRGARTRWGRSADANSLLPRTWC